MKNTNKAMNKVERNEYRNTTAIATPKKSVETVFNTSEFINAMHKAYDKLNAYVFSNCLPENIVITFSDGIEKNSCVRKNAWHEKKNENNTAWEIAIRGESLKNSPAEFGAYLCESLVEMYADSFNIKVTASGGYYKNKNFVTICNEVGFISTMPKKGEYTFELGEHTETVFEIMAELSLYMKIYRDESIRKDAEKQAKQAEKAEKTGKKSEKTEKENVHSMVKMGCPKCNAVAYLPIKIAIACVTCNCEFVGVTETENNEQNEQDEQAE